MINSLAAQNALMGVAAVTVSVMTLGWFSAPAMMTVVTGAAAGIVVAGASWIALTTWRNAQATENVSHAFNRADAHRLERR